MKDKQFICGLFATENEIEKVDLSQKMKGNGRRERRKING